MCVFSPAKWLKGVYIICILKCLHCMFFVHLSLSVWCNSEINSGHMLLCDTAAKQRCGEEKYSFILKITRKSPREAVSYFTVVGIKIYSSIMYVQNIWILVRNKNPKRCSCWIPASFLWVCLLRRKLEKPVGGFRSVLSVSEGLISLKMDTMHIFTASVREIKWWWHCSWEAGFLFSFSINTFSHFGFQTSL